MIASLPMYDAAPINRANDTFWSAIANNLDAAPPSLCRDGDVWGHWCDPDLILSQTCGLPFRAKLHGKVQYLCTPDYGLPDCPAGYYYSYIIAKSSDVVAHKATPAVNDALSQSGWAALCDWAQASGIALAAPVISGGHAQSIGMVQSGQADLAAIDAVTWRMLDAGRTDLSGLVIIAQTRATPSLPYICGRNQDLHVIQNAVKTAYDHLGQDVKSTLGIKGLVNIPLSEYLSEPLPPVIA
jgi:ABC-type phosphate/phosphonate transport system substrate-binding protein